MCSALRFCLSVYLSLSPRGISRLLYARPSAPERARGANRSARRRSVDPAERLARILQRVGHLRALLEGHDSVVAPLDQQDRRVVPRGETGPRERHFRERRARPRKGVPPPRGSPYVPPHHGPPETLDLRQG